MSERPTPIEVPGHVLEQVIGRGATSVVWAGRDPVGRPVAIKVPHERADAVDLAQSATERQVLTAVRHPHLVSLRAVVALSDGRVATVFDRVDGASLRSTVDARGHLRPGETVTVVTPICEATAALHRAGAIHGDIAPGNVLVTAGGRPLLADLGGARVAGTGGVVVGTPGFVAPEVLSGAPPTTAADVYALGAIAWYCLTGTPPPRTPIRMRPQEVTDRVGAELAEVVAACIDPDPSRRPLSGQLAPAFYAATPPEPIEVVVGADETSALTHRLRMNAAAAASPEPVGQRARWRRAWEAARTWPGDCTSRLTRGRVALALAVTLLLAGGAAWAGEAAGDGGRGPSTAGSAPSAVAPSTSSAAPTPIAAGRPGPASTTTARDRVDVTADPLAPERSAEALLRTLAERRIALLVRRDAQALAGVHRQASPAWRADAAVLAELERNQQRYDGLSVAAVSARTISFTGDRAVVRARVGLTAYAVVASSGRRESRPATSGQDLDVTIVRTAQGWRIESISEPAST